MPTLVTVRRDFVVEALLDIEDKDFASWYGLGMYWSMFGDNQTHGRYCDGYLITNIERGIRAGYYSNLASGWYPMIGFKLGMVHGGFLAEPRGTLVVLTDQDFSRGYYVGRNYHFTEAVLEGRIFSDRLLNEAVYEWALGYQEWHEAPSVLRYCLGCRIGELSAAVIPEAEPVTTSSVIRL